MPYIPYAHQSIDDSAVEAAAAALRGDMITRGEAVEAFEKAVAAYCGAEFAVAFNSGSSALLAAYHAAELNPMDRVITTPNSFVATIGPAFLKGVNVLFVDIDRASGNLNVEQTAAAINSPHSRGRTFVVPVHYAGIAVDMRTLDTLMKNPDVVVIEDAAQAFGSYYPDGKTRVGSCAWSQMTIFSFHPAKIITTGEGGMVTTNDPALYERLKLYRNNGIQRKSTWEYDIAELSGNFHMTEFQAALGQAQLKRIDEFLKKRRALVKAYRERLEGFTLLHDDENMAPHLFVIQSEFAKKPRQQVIQELHEKGIGTQIHYIPIYRFAFYKKLKGDVSENFPEMERFYREALTLPLHVDLTTRDVGKIVSALQEAVQ